MAEVAGNKMTSVSDGESQPGEARARRRKQVQETAEALMEVRGCLEIRESDRCVGRDSATLDERRVIWSLGYEASGPGKPLATR
jgi:hypothetical protein